MTLSREQGAQAASRASGSKHLFLSLTFGWFVLALALLKPGEAQAAYASDFTLTNHATGQPMRLSDFAGSIVVLDFLSPACTQCQSATPDLHVNIREYFQNIAGNRDGWPVTVVCINESTNRAATDAFIASNHLDLVLDDTPDRAVLAQFGFSIPLFVVINGITNDANYPAWQILGTQFGYTTNSTVLALRNYIEAVRGTRAPTLSRLRLGTNRVFSAELNAQKGRTNWLDATTNLVNWFPLTNFVGSNSIPILDPDASRFPLRMYRIRVE